MHPHAAPHTLCTRPHAPTPSPAPAPAAENRTHRGSSTRHSSPAAAPTRHAPMPSDVRPAVDAPDDVCTRRMRRHRTARSFRLCLAAHSAKRKKKEPSRTLRPDVHPTPPCVAKIRGRKTPALQGNGVLPSNPAWSSVLPCGAQTCCAASIRPALQTRLRRLATPDRRKDARPGAAIG